MDIKKYKRDFGFGALVITLILIWYLGRYTHLDISFLKHLLEKLTPTLSAAVYILLYVVVTFFIFFSKDLFWLVAALLFGPYWGALFICIAETINAGILFYLARFLGRGYVEDKLSRRYKYLDEKLGRISIIWLFVFRAAPLIPFRFLDLAAGLTKMKFRKYLLAVILGTPVKMLWIEYILCAVGQSIFNNPDALRAYLLSNRPLLLFSFIYIILVVMAIFKIGAKE